MDSQDELDLFGKNVFNDSTMRKYLSRDKYMRIKRVIEDNLEFDEELAKKLAEAMKSWAIDQGAKYYTHWFQPLNGTTAEKHNSFLFPNSEDGVIYEFPFESLFIGESDASSFPSGGLRTTFEARGYTKWDYNSPAFIKEHKTSKVLCIPTIFVSHNGESLDKKQPLLKSCVAIDKEARRLINVLDEENNISKVFPTIGAEQEYFLIAKEMYNKRKDLKTVGRTLFGAEPSKAQQMSDHYLGNIKEKIVNFMDEVDEELLKLGILSATRHNEVAPCQYELAPYFNEVNLSTDQNQLIMETLKSVAEKHDLVCLLHEKPFDGINGSGKHNNWSLSTDTGENLLSMGKTPEENTRFLLIITAIISAIDEYSNLLRATTATATNDRRLSGFEAPPSIISVFIGEDLQNIFNTKSKIKKEIAISDNTFREKDKILQLVNMPEERIFNGDIGIISNIDKKEIYIDFDTNEVKFTPSNFNKFKLGYAISIHKSQGSEFDIVVIPVTKAYGKMLYRKLYYTAVTRAKKRLIIIGDINALEYAAGNNTQDVRKTTIKNKIIRKMNI